MSIVLIRIDWAWISRGETNQNYKIENPQLQDWTIVTPCYLVIVWFLSDILRQKLEEGVVDSGRWNDDGCLDFISFRALFNLHPHCFFSIVLKLAKVNNDENLRHLKVFQSVSRIWTNLIKLCNCYGLMLKLMLTVAPAVSINDMVNCNSKLIISQS